MGSPERVDWGDRRVGTHEPGPGGRAPSGAACCLPGGWSPDAGLAARADRFDRCHVDVTRKRASAARAAPARPSTDGVLARTASEPGRRPSPDGVLALDRRQDL